MRLHEAKRPARRLPSIRMPRTSSVRYQADPWLLPFEVHVEIRKCDDGKTSFCCLEEALRKEGRRLQPVRGGLHRAGMLPVLEDSIKVVSRGSSIKNSSTP